MRSGLVERRWGICLDIWMLLINLVLDTLFDDCSGVGIRLSRYLAT